MVNRLPLLCHRWRKSYLDLVARPPDFGRPEATQLVNQNHAFSLKRQEMGCRVGVALDEHIPNAG